ncbi:hypothetical protein [Enterococcus sp. RIT-PI-f]|uniref:hypothetical protein n=1 Tax=Enterococcus sp. RIT-PI-f TaxID=1690244 RepID=UPI0006B92830|nr:hypothetical protein [Enterococcus sp. RIT-PI-f]KPG71403.1 hypothetical protein AEQ18_04320 [Enterococcus sp. RIT-PI-f]
MSKSNKRFFWLSILLTVIHLIGSSYYLYAYAYFNGQGHASAFAAIVTVLRIMLLAWFAYCGYRALHDQQKLTWLYIALFFVNLVCPYLFQ